MRLATGEGGNCSGLINDGIQEIFLSKNVSAIIIIGGAAYR